MWKHRKVYGFLTPAIALVLLYSVYAFLPAWIRRRSFAYLACMKKRIFSEPIGSFQDMRIGVVTPLFPTSGEPYRGAAIWNTLRALKAYAEISVYCVHPRYPPFVGPRSFRYQSQPAETLQYGLPAQMVSYFAVPWATRMWNTHRIHARLKSTFRGASLDLLLCYWIGPESCAAVRLGQELGIPVVFGARGTDLAKPNKNLVRTKASLPGDSTSRSRVMRERRSGPKGRGHGRSQRSRVHHSKRRGSNCF